MKNLTLFSKVFKICAPQNIDSLIFAVNNSKINEAYKYSNKLKFKNQNFLKAI